ncbi:uncharacterized protein BO72DRAFT_171642 [Aspergillus fijiensis CBS 313.89]|uniref:Uncharacterized protein n=1 Tax=Aspergillus fijiensis CBS 313.89 TaxID=1448319 RepID=A0A8G1RLH4_9EURO|nr:uncharacterized protein BO72DRAFT_171642 [Aspergillus fijiensis CBS 313.89]RAK75470.1 hypothetical protein BO72DRAFT_171642 [Aspergillus fijiensis CBS 313.89]
MMDHGCLFILPIYAMYDTSKIARDSGGKRSVMAEYPLRVAANTPPRLVSKARTNARRAEKKKKKLEAAKSRHPRLRRTRDLETNENNIVETVKGNVKSNLHRRVRKETWTIISKLGIVEACAQGNIRRMRKEMDMDRSCQRSIFARRSNRSLDSGHWSMGVPIKEWSF